MKTIYIPDFATDITITTLLAEIPWGVFTAARSECFMAAGPERSYTYGKGTNARTYSSISPHPAVLAVQNKLNLDGSRYNVCFLNLYSDDHQHLGWHADDSPTMDQDHPISSVSFGEEREIWWRVKGFKGEIPLDQRQLLGHGSAFIMPAGFQRDHEHRIPKGARAMRPRVSMTFRRFLDVE